MTTTTVETTNISIHRSLMELHEHIFRLQESVVHNTLPLSPFESEMVHHYIEQSKSMIERINLLVKMRNDMPTSDAEDEDQHSSNTVSDIH